MSFYQISSFHHDCLLIERVYFFNQAPTHSTVTLSSGSESSHNGSPIVEERTDWEESSLCKSSKITDKDKNHGKIQGDSSAESLSDERSRSKSPEKGQGPKIEDLVLEKNKSGNHKKGKGKTRFGVPLFLWLSK